MITPADGAVWITGASSGIGRATALELAHRGWTVVASARREEALQSLADEAEGMAGSILVRPLDITDHAAVDACIASIEADIGPMAVAIANAGTYFPDTLEQFDIEVFDKTVQLNLVSTAKVIGAAVKVMTPRAKGQVMIVSSVAGYSGLPNAISYGATKAALINMAEAMCLEAKRLGLTVTLVNPGFVKTPLTDKNTFEMPALMPVDRAARRMADAVGTNRFEVTFPRRFTYWLKLLRCLPYAVYFPLIRRMTKI